MRDDAPRYVLRERGVTVIRQENVSSRVDTSAYVSPAETAVIFPFCTVATASFSVRHVSGIFLPSAGVLIKCSHAAAPSSSVISVCERRKENLSSVASETSAHEENSAATARNNTEKSAANGERGIFKFLELCLSFLSAFIENSFAI